MSRRGGKRLGAGRPKGSKNKSTIAKECVAEILDLDDATMLEAAIHKRGHILLSEMERIATDPTQPVGARIMATRTALPFLLPRHAQHSREAEKFGNNLIQVLERRRNQLAHLRLKHTSKPKIS